MPDVSDPVCGFFEVIARKVRLKRIHCIYLSIFIDRVDAGRLPVVRITFTRTTFSHETGDIKMPAENISPKEALRRLEDGNRRFVSGVKSVDTLPTHNQRTELAENGQRPYAIVLGCADSRAPAELIFDAGLGDLFVVRVAGNIVAPSLLGSIEFAATNFKTPLCIVLGHTMCGAVAATADLVASKRRAPTDHIQDIVLEIEPSVRRAMAAGAPVEAPHIVEEATRLNVKRSVERIAERSAVLSELVANGSFQIVGGVYNLRTGLVDFFESRGSIRMPESLSNLNISH